MTRAGTYPPSWGPCGCGLAAQDVRDTIDDVGGCVEAAELQVKYVISEVLGFSIMTLVVVIMCRDAFLDGLEGGAVGEEAVGGQTGRLTGFTVKYRSYGKWTTVRPSIKVTSDGTATATVNLDSTVDRGSAITVITDGVQPDGSPYRQIRQIIPLGPATLMQRVKATPVAKKTKYKTLVARSLDGETSDGRRRLCSGPFNFRIQQLKRVTHRKAGKATGKSVWKSLSIKYQTNKSSRLWSYRTVDLKKGTYRSIIEGRCGTYGSLTNPVTLNR